MAAGVCRRAFSRAFCINFVDKTPRCAADTLGQCYEVTCFEISANSLTRKAGPVNRFVIGRFEKQPWVVLTPGHDGIPDRRPHNVLRVRRPHRDTQELQTSHGHHRYLAIMSSTSIYTIAIIWKPSILNTWWKKRNLCIFNRPGVAGAVLLTPLLLIH